MSSPLETILQGARGLAALIGVPNQPYDVLRLSATTPSTGILADTPIATGLLMKPERASKTAIEGESFILIAFEAICNDSGLELGDVLVGGESDTFVVAQMRPPNRSIVVRAEQTATVKRPFPLGGAGAFVNQPMSGPIAAPDGTWSSRPKASEQVLTLETGSYAFSPAGASAVTVTVGLQPLAHLADNKDFKIADATARARFIGYVPLLPGVEIYRNDIVQTIDGSTVTGRYTVLTSYSSRSTGLTGWVCVLEKIH